MEERDKNKYSEAPESLVLGQYEYENNPDFSST
jgi:hypothetical protein